RILSFAFSRYGGIPNTESMPTLRKALSVPSRSEVHALSGHSPAVAVFCFRVAKSFFSFKSILFCHRTPAEAAQRRTADANNWGLDYLAACFGSSITKARE